jgi:Transposase IS116/IS110/IS902 family
VVAAAIVAELAEDILGLKDGLQSIDEELEQRSFARSEPWVLISLPGMGPILGAEFLVCMGEISAFENADRLAASMQILSPRLVTPASGLATTEGCEEGTRSSSGSSTSLHWPAYAVPRSPGSSTTAREPKARGILRLSHHSSASEGQRAVGDAA